MGAVTNNQNDRVYARSSGDSPVKVSSQFRRKKPVCDKVWAAVALDLRKSRLAFIDEGLEVTRQVYLNMMQKKNSSLAHRTFRD